MAFHFNWPKFSEHFYTNAKDLLTTALNKGPVPPIIVDKIVVKELDMGTCPPELEILEIGDLAEDRFRGIFKMRYHGDAEIVLQTKVQANPLNTRKRTTPSFTNPSILAADAPLVVPMLLRLSQLRLSGIIILVFSKQKGITLVFRNDPVENVDVNSTFDSIPAIQRFLQQEIETVLRNLFQEDLPAIIHKLSLQWMPAALRRQSIDGTRPINPYEIDSRLRMEFNNSLDEVSEFADFSTPLQFSSASIERLQELTKTHLTLCPSRIEVPHTIYRSSNLQTLLDKKDDNDNAYHNRRRPIRHRSTLSANEFIPYSIPTMPWSTPQSPQKSASRSEDGLATPSTSTSEFAFPMRPKLYTAASTTTRPGVHTRRKVKHSFIRLSSDTNLDTTSSIPSSSPIHTPSKRPTTSVIPTSRLDPDIKVGSPWHSDKKEAIQQPLKLEHRASEQALREQWQHQLDMQKGQMNLDTSSPISRRKF